MKHLLNGMVQNVRPGFKDNGEWLETITKLAFRRSSHQSKKKKKHLALTMWWVRLRAGRKLKLQKV